MSLENKKEVREFMESLRKDTSCYYHDDESGFVTIYKKGDIVAYSRSWDLESQVFYHKVTKTSNVDDGSQDVYLDCNERFNSKLKCYQLKDDNFTTGFGHL